MSLQICPYTGLSIPQEEMNREHPLPESIGGGDSLVVGVYRRVNESLGSSVDADFVNSPAMKLYRALHGIGGKKGEVPWYESKQDVQVGDQSVPVVIKQRWGPDGAHEVDIRSRDVRSEDPTGRWMTQTVQRSTPEETERVLAEILAKTEKRAGRTLNAQPVRVYPTWVRIPSEFHGTVAWEVAGRFMAKAALGLATKRFGPEWALSPFAAELRQIAHGHLDCTSAALVRARLINLKHVRGPELIRRLTPFRTNPKEEHEVGLIPFRNGVRLHVILFGVLAAHFRVHVPGAVRRPQGIAVRFKERGRIRRLEPVS